MVSEQGLNGFTVAALGDVDASTAQFFDESGRGEVSHGPRAAGYVGYSIC